MKLTPEELAELRRYRNEPDEDNVRYKQIIKKKLLANNKLLYLLHNKDLEDEGAEPDEYLGTSILPYLLLPQVQHNVQNYLCFETSFENVSRGCFRKAVMEFLSQRKLLLFLYFYTLPLFVLMQIISDSIRC